MNQEFPLRFSDIIKKAVNLVGSIESTYEGASVFTLEDILHSKHAQEEESREKRLEINKLLSDLKEFYNSIPTSKKDADAQVIITDTRAFAYLTLIPPHPGAKMPTIEELIKQIDANGIVHQVNFDAIRSAYDVVSKKKETVYSLKIAQCTLPEKGEPALIDYKVKYLNKSQIFDENIAFTGDILSLLENINIGMIVAKISTSGIGKPGMDVRGEEIPPVHGSRLDIEFGEGLKIAPNERDVYAVSNGCLVLDGKRLDVIPFYIVNGDLKQGQDINFDGNALVNGNVVGPVTINAEDVYICGNIEGGCIYAKGDVFIKGSFLGKKMGFIESEGKVFARSISDAKVATMGDIVARNSITYSEISSSNRVRVMSEKGALIGGSIFALKGITAKTIGSDFGTYTMTCVGKDFLTPKRLSILEEKIKEYEIWLAKIELLKKRLGETGLDLAKLDPRKQDAYVAVLQKELNTRTELSSLKRSKERFEKAITEFLDAGIQVLDEIFPPVRVQIVDTIEEIRERLKQVTLVLDREHKKIKTTVS